MAGRSSSVHDDYGRSSLSPGPPSLPGKRKFEDPPEAPRRTTGFSDAKDYRSVPPMSDFELAKQKAEQIAARLVGQEFKKSRNDEHESASGNNVDRGHSHSYGSEDRHDFYQPPSIRRMDVPNAKVGLVIGKGGETIRNLQQQSGAKIQVTRDNEVDPSSNARQVELSGTAEQISRAEQLIREVIGDTGGGGGGGAALVGAGEPLQIRVPNNKVGLVIGKGGETIKSLQAMSGARIQVQHDRETEPGATERVVTLTGTKQQTDMAQDLIKDVIGEGRRGYAAGGFQQNYRGGSQQWGQSGYGYQQGYGNQQYGGYWDGQQGQQGSYDYYQNQTSEGQQNNNEGYNYQQGYYGYDQQYAGLCRNRERTESGAEERLESAKMPKNKGKGGKNRKRGKNEADDEKRELVFKEDGQEYAQVIRMLGNGRCESMCIDGVKRMCHIRGKMHKKVWIAAGDIILVGLRDYQDDKADVILKYQPDEARLLKAYNELPDNIRLNEGIHIPGDDEEEGDDYIEFEDEDIDKI